MNQPPTRFYCVAGDSVPETTTALLQQACDQREVAYHEVYPATFDFARTQPLQPGDLLFRPSCSPAAIGAEQCLVGPGVATFYPDEDAAFHECTNPLLVFRRAGLPVPPTVPVVTTDRDVLRGHVAELGGFPLVVKVDGGECGIGVMRVDSFAGLFSLIDHLGSQGVQPLLSAFIPDALHWRLVVVGNRVVAAYPNHVVEDDFRSKPSTDPAEYVTEAPPDLAAVAVRAVHAMRREFGGVDVLADGRGRLVLLEANFPCYFPVAQTAAGIDVAGAMIDYLLEKAAARKRRAARPMRRRTAMCG